MTLRTSTRTSRFIEWVGSHELTVLVGMFIIVAGTWTFIALAGEVVEGDTQALDERIILALRQPDDPTQAIGPPWLFVVARDLTALGGYSVLTLVMLGAVGFLALARKFAAMWFVLGAIVGGNLLTIALKALFNRPRPEVVPHLAHAYNTSFPSGHSMMSAVVFLTLGALLTELVRNRRLKFYFLAVAILLTLLVGTSRVYLGVHYPTDVLAGWAAGLVWSTACCLVARALQRGGRIETDL